VHSCLSTTLSRESARAPPHNFASSAPSRSTTPTVAAGESSSITHPWSTDLAVKWFSETVKERDATVGDGTITGSTILAPTDAVRGCVGECICAWKWVAGVGSLSEQPLDSHNNNTHSSSQQACALVAGEVAGEVACSSARLARAFLRFSTQVVQLPCASPAHLTH